MTSPSGLWAEGDTLSPTNLNKRNPAGNFPAKTYHVAWAASTGTTQISNAIVNAVVGGYNTLFIDASRFPYDTSAISDIYTVRRIREGGPLDLSLVDPGAYGASVGANTGPNDYAALQGCLDLINSLKGSNGPAMLDLAAGTTYTIAKPLWVRTDGTRILGKSRGGYLTQQTLQTLIRPSFKYGPAILGSGANDTVDTLVTALATGTGSAWQPVSAANQFFNLRDVASCELNGLSAFTFECYYKHSGNGMLVSSQAEVSGNSTLQRCFFVQTNANKLRFYLTTTGGTIDITGATTLVSGTTYHLAATYDGTTARIFVAGVLDNSAPLTGTLLQDPIEDVRLNGGASTPDYGTNDNGFASTSVLDSIRLSNTARYTAAFTAPTAKFSNDANTLALLNFDLQIGPMTRAQTKDGDAWLPVRRYGSGTGATDVEIGNLSLRPGAANTTSGIYWYGGGHLFNFHDICTDDCRWGIKVLGNDTFGGTIRNLQGSNCNRVILQLGQNVTFTTIQNAWGEALGTFGVMLESGACDYRNSFLESGLSTVIPLIVRSAGNSIRAVNIGTEGGTGGTYLNSILVSSGGVALHPITTISDCGIESGNSVAPIRFDTASDADSSLIFSNCLFSFPSGGTPGSLMTVVGPTPPVPVLFERPRMHTAWLPLSNITGAAVLGRLGTQYSTSTGSTLVFNAYAADEWDLTLTSDVTQSSWSKIQYGQPVSGAIKMDSTGSRLFVWPTNSKGTATLSYGSAAVNTFTGFYDGVNVILTSVRTGL